MPYTSLSLKMLDTISFQPMSKLKLRRLQKLYVITKIKYAGKEIYAEEVKCIPKNYK